MSMPCLNLLPYPGDQSHTLCRRGKWLGLRVSLGRRGLTRCGTLVPASARPLSMALPVRAELSKMAWRPSPCPLGYRQWVKRVEARRGAGRTVGGRGIQHLASDPVTPQSVTGLDQEPSFHLLCRSDCKLSLNGSTREMSVS